MSKKEKKQKKEKPLHRMTVKELKEIALGIEGVVGVHSMNKNELLSIIKEHRGIEEEKKKKGRGVREIKKKIRELKAQREQARLDGDEKMAAILRRRISRLKKKTRRAA